MWRYDFHLFYLAGQAVLHGVSPYAIPDFNAPYLLALLFVPLTLLPESMAYALFVGVQLLLLWRQRGRRALWALLAFPVWFDLFVGQVDLLLALVSAAIGPWALPLLLAKPQVGFVIAPWLLWESRNKPRLLLKIALLSAGFLAFSFFIRPTWLREWLAAVPTLTEYSCRDSNIYWLVPLPYKEAALGVGMILALLLFLSPWVKNRRTSWTLQHIFAPLTNIYSSAVLFEWIGPLEAGLSWAAILWAGGIHGGAPMFIMAVAILLQGEHPAASVTAPTAE